MNRTILETYTGSEDEVVIAYAESGDTITAIGAKAFLSCKSIKKLEIAGSVTEIGDWAFAHMQNLQILTLPKRKLVFGKKVFLDCGNLMQIQISGDESNNPGTPFFLASAIRILKKEELCKPEEAGDVRKHREWIQSYDNALLSFLEEEDEKGFDPVFFGWFRVEDIDDQLPGFLAKKRSEKAQLVLQRLLYPDYLSDAAKGKMCTYIREHVPEKEEKKEHTAVFDFLCEAEECGRDVRYFKILKEIGCLNVRLTEQFLERIKTPSPEVTAFLLREKAEKREKNFFEGFEF